MAAGAADGRVMDVCVGPGDDGDDAEAALFKVRTVDEIDWKTALKIGCFQMLAIIPGTSRSGSTIKPQTLSVEQDRLCSSFIYSFRILTL